jgi:hypothetical protein
MEEERWATIVARLDRPDGNPSANGYLRRLRRQRREAR